MKYEKEIESQEAHLEFRWMLIAEIKNINFFPKEFIELIENIDEISKKSYFMTTME